MVHGEYAYQLFGILTGYPLRKTITLKKPPEFDHTGAVDITAGCRFTHHGDFCANLPAAQRYHHDPITYDLSYVLQLENAEHEGVHYWKPAAGIVIVRRPHIIGCVAECTYGLSWNATGAVTLLAHEPWVANSYRGMSFLDREVVPNELREQDQYVDA